MNSFVKCQSKSYIQNSISLKLSFLSSPSSIMIGSKQHFYVTEKNNLTKSQLIESRAFRKWHVNNLGKNAFCTSEHFGIVVKSKLKFIRSCSFSVKHRWKLFYFEMKVCRSSHWIICLMYLDIQMLDILCNNIFLDLVRSATDESITQSIIYVVNTMILFEPST